MKMFKLIIVLTFICGGLYPGFITLVSEIFFSEKAQGSLILLEGKIVGSKLLAQNFSRDDFFHSRPSAANYATVASGASHLSVTMKNGDKETASGSGLDPHITPESARAEVLRVSLARGLESEKLFALIDQHTEGATLGIWGQPRVNVLELNLAIKSAGRHGDTRSTSRNP